MLREWIEAIESGERSAQQWLEACLARIHEREREVHAWAAVEPQPATGSGPLRGVPFGAKDIFDTEAMPTAWGTDLYAERRAPRDAAVVAALRDAGAVLLGKTQTTAFAYFDPPATRNPRAPGRTPGGSSSGSAAAVAAGMAAFALGTQTQGSVLRPASYCGVAGFKPSFGLLPVEGVLPFAPSLDTVGLFTATAADMQVLWQRGFGGVASAPLTRAVMLRVGAEAPMIAAVEDAAARLRAAGVPVDAIEVPDGFAELGSATRTVNDYEGARTHEARWREFGSRIGVKLSELVVRGLAIPREEYDAALARMQRMKSVFGDLFWEYPLLLCAAATGAAPEGFASTGDPAANAPWTALGVPAMSIPMAVEGPPLGLQAIAAWGRDDALLAVGVEVERMIGEAGPRARAVL